MRSNQAQRAAQKGNSAAASGRDPAALPHGNDNSSIISRPSLSLKPGLY